MLFFPPLSPMADVRNQYIKQKRVSFRVESVYTFVSFMCWG